MRAMRKCVAGILLGCLLLCCGVAGAAPAKGTEIDLGGCDFVFVDADEDIGYYVDLNEQNFRNDKEVVARVELVKAGQKQLHLYTVYFNRQRQLYQVLSSVVADYDSKLVVSATDQPLRPAHYETGTMMAVLADYIFDPY